MKNKHSMKVRSEFDGQRFIKITHIWQMGFLYELLGKWTSAAALCELRFNRCDPSIVLSNELLCKVVKPINSKQLKQHVIISLLFINDTWQNRW